MNKKLTAKVQKLTTDIKTPSNNLSDCIIIEPEETSTILKKGNLYAVIDIKSTDTLDKNLIRNIVTDVLHDSYYQSDNISPIQSLEKAILEVNEKVTKISNESLDSQESKTDFNIIAGVLWGNVLYVVKFNKGNGFLMREGEIKEISTTSEGNFAVASGVIKNGDVVVLSTEKFSQKFPPKKLLESALSPKDLETDQSSLVMKFMVSTSFTKAELVNFKTPSLSRKSKINIADIRKKLIKKKTKQQSVSTIARSIKKPLNIKIKKSLKPKFSIKLLIPIVVVSLIVSIVVQRKIIVEPHETPVQNDVPQQDTPQQNTLDYAFYDIKLADTAANPENIVVFNNTVVVTDKKSGKIFTSDITTPQFVEKKQTFPGIDNVENVGGALYFTDNEGYKIYDLINESLDRTYVGDFGITSSYIGNIYSLKDSDITKYVPSDNTLQENNWGSSTDFDGAKAVDTSYSIYVVTKENSIVAYTGGEKGQFEVTGLDKDFANLTSIVADIELEYIYIADTGNNRVVLIDNDGKFIKQFQIEDSTAWGNIKDIAISKDESTLWVLDGSRVYKKDLVK